MSSFYGGKQGRTYHIVARFDAVYLDVNSYQGKPEQLKKGDIYQENGKVFFVLDVKTTETGEQEVQVRELKGMVNCFQNGGAYTQVNYGQYVLIDTILNRNAKSDPQNGLIYRRGFDYQDDPSNHKKPNQSNYKDEQNNLKKEEWQSAWSSWILQPGAGAIYVGQIVGPQGDSPEIIPVAWSEVSSKDGWQEVNGSASKGKQIITDPDTGQQTIKYNDSIKIASVNLKDDQGNIIGAKIAFDIPTAIMEAEIVNSNPYSKASVSQDTTSQDHPFWYKWNFVIPGGKKGTSLENLKIETGSEIGQYVKTDDKQRDINKTYYIYNQENNTYNEFTFEEQSQVDFSNLYERLSLSLNDQYLTYSLRGYDDNEEGAVIEQHKGRWPYRVIDKIEFLTDSNISQQRKEWQSFSDNPTARIGDAIPIYQQNTRKQIGYIKTEDTQPQEGKTYYQEVDNEGIISYDKINIQQIINPKEANLYEKRTTEIPENVHIEGLYFICTKSGNVNINVTPPSYSENTKIGQIFESGTTKWRLTKISKDAPINTLRVSYTAGEQDSGQLRNLDFLTVDDKDDLYAVYSNSAEPQFLTSVGGIEKIFLTNKDNYVPPTPEERGGQRFEVKYKGHETSTPISQYINTVLALDRVGDSIIMLYSDPVVRSAIPKEKKFTKDWTDPITGITYKDLIWYKFGPWTAQYHVQGDYTYSDLLGDKTAEDYSIDLSEGLENAGFPERSGWLVTVSKQVEVQGETQIIKHIYAYDYNDKSTEGKYTINGTHTHWYEVMSLDGASADPGSIVIVNKNEPQGNYRNGTIWCPISYGHDNY